MFKPCEKYPRRCPAGTEISEKREHGMVSFGTHEFKRGKRCQFECRVDAKRRAEEPINHSVWAIIGGRVVDIGG